MFNDYEIALFDLEKGYCEDLGRFSAEEFLAYLQTNLTGNEVFLAGPKSGQITIIRRGANVSRETAD